MDKQRLDAIRARCERATPVEWECANKSVRVVGTQQQHSFGKTAPTGYEGGICNCLGGSSYRAGKNDPINVQARANADFIAHARTDVPDMLAEIERLTTALKLLESDRDAERKIRLDAEAEMDAWRRRAEAAERDITIMLGTQRVCFICANRTPCNNSTTGEYACDPKWRGPEEDKHE